MDFEHGFAIWRELGVGRDGDWLPFAALTAIHVTHRLGALLVFAAIGLLAWGLRRSGSDEARRWAWRLLAVALWQFVSGMSNVVLDWPLLAALAHTGGAAALMVILSFMLARIEQGRTLVQRPAVAEAMARA